jgi:benzoyl-CoA 2,3-dioxygenase component B
MKGLERWNRTLEGAGLPDRLRLPNRKFHRHIGIYAGHRFDLDGGLIDDATWATREPEWLPSVADRAYVKSLMRPVFEPGKMASWIAPPRKGVNSTPLDYAYVRL